MVAERRPQLRVESMRWNPRAKLSSRTIIEDSHLIFRQSISGTILVDRELKSEEVEEVQKLVERLDQIELQDSYGKDHEGSWPVTRLDIARIEPKFRRRIEVETNPYSPPPPEVIDLMRYLRMLV